MIRRRCRYFNRPGGCHHKENCRFYHDGELDGENYQIESTTQKLAKILTEVESLEQEVNQLRGENYRLNQRESMIKCTICMEIKRANDFAVNVPCGHVFCHHCNQSLSNDCATCRRYVTTKVKLFI